MTHMIGGISLLVAILLMAIVNYANSKRIKELEKRVAMLTIRTERKLTDD